MLDDRPLPRDLEFAIQNKSPDALFSRLWGYCPKPHFECLYYKLIGRLFQGIVLRILSCLPFQGTFPSFSYFVADHTPIFHQSNFPNHLTRTLLPYGFRQLKGHEQESGRTFVKTASFEDRFFLYLLRWQETILRHRKT